MSELRVAFSSPRDEGDARIFTVAADGTQREQLTDGPGKDYFPAWSSDGRWMAFGRNHGGRTGLHLYDVQTGTVTTLATGLDFASSPAFSPEGAQVASEGSAPGAGRHDVYTVPLAGGTPRRLTDDPASDAGPAWSPDGQTIYFVSDRAGAFEIYAMGAGGEDQRAIGQGTGILGRPAPSPDGRNLAFARRVAGEQSTEIVRLDLESREMTVLTSDNDSEPAHGPAGRWIAFVTARFGMPEVMLLDAEDPAQQTRLTDHPAIDSAPAIGRVR